MKALITTDIELEPASLPADLEVRICEDHPSAIDAALDDSVEILVAESMPGAIDRCAGLRWIQLLSSGTDQLIGHPLMERDLLLSNAAGTNAVHIAEFVVARILEHVKGLRQFERLQQARQWPADRVALARPSLRGMCAALVGYGGVGRETARLLAALGLRIIAVTSSATRRPYAGYTPYDGFGDPQVRLPERLFVTAELHTVLPAADVVVLALPLLPATRRLIDAAALACMKSSVILINVARGPILDTAALLAALDAGRLAHAYLDVFEAEPLPPDSPLWDHPRVSISPHIAGTMPNHARKLSDLFLANLERYRAGRPLLSALDRHMFRRG
jgi:phosphoglycerate dehydrogenase-like enzyme